MPAGLPFPRGMAVEGWHQWPGTGVSGRGAQPILSWGGMGVTALPACCLSVRPLSCPTGTPWQSALVSLQGAALKYLPSILEDVFGIFDSSMLG